MKIIWNTELYHYGMPRRSGRYKWGSGEDPYHHGASIPRGLQKKKDKLAIKRAQNNSDMKNAKSIGDGIGKYQKRKEKLDRKIAKNNEKIKQAKKAFEERKKAISEEQNNFSEKQKGPSPEKLESIKRSGDPKKILAYRKYYSDSEYQAVLKRANTDKALRSIMKEQQDSGRKKVENVVSLMDKIVKGVGGAYDAYNKYSQIAEGAKNIADTVKSGKEKNPKVSKSSSNKDTPNVNTYKVSRPRRISRNVPEPPASVKPYRLNYNKRKVNNTFMYRGGPNVLYTRKKTDTSLPRTYGNVGKYKRKKYR